MEPIINQVPVTTSTDNSESYVKLELGKAGAIEIAVKAGIDATPELMTERTNLALEAFKLAYNDDVIKKHVKELKI